MFPPTNGIDFNVTLRRVAVWARDNEQFCIVVKERDRSFNVVGGQRKEALNILRNVVQSASLCHDSLTSSPCLCWIRGNIPRGGKHKTVRDTPSGNRKTGRTGEHTEHILQVVTHGGRCRRVHTQDAHHRVYLAGYTTQGIPPSMPGELYSLHYSLSSLHARRALCATLPTWEQKESNTHLETKGEEIPTWEQKE